jgi:hypothetical protein
MVPAALSALAPRDSEWICLECEETAGPDVDRTPGRERSHQPLA